MKDLILGSVTNYTFDKVKNWVNSIDKSGFDGYRVMIAYNVGYEIVEELSKKQFTVITFNQDDLNRRYTYRENFNIVVDRFYHYWKTLSQIQSEVRYVIATDVKDVVFQTNPTEWFDANQHDGLIASSEGIRYGHEHWNNNNMKLSFPFVHDYMLNKTVYNAGVIAGKIDVIKDLFLNIFTTCVNMPHTIPGGGGPDQAAYNVLLTMSSYQSQTMFSDSKDAWAAQLGVLADPTKISSFRPYLLDDEPIMKNENVCNKNGIPFCVVHQYDRVPEWKKIIDKKYD